MNPLTNVRNITKLNEREIALGIDEKTSWHALYKDSAWVFIGGLQFDLTEGDIIAVFSQYGEVVNINLVRDKYTGKPKGFCFLCYEDQRSTVLAVDNLNGIKLCGRIIRVDHVAKYRPPKEDEDDDIATKQLHSKGCAPRTVSSSSSESDEPRNVEKKRKRQKKEKHKKKKGKKEKKIKKEKPKSTDSSSEQDIVEEETIRKSSTYGKVKRGSSDRRGETIELRKDNHETKPATRHVDHRDVGNSRDGGQVDSIQKPGYKFQNSWTRRLERSRTPLLVVGREHTREELLANKRRFHQDIERQFHRRLESRTKQERRKSQDVDTQPKSSDKTSEDRRDKQSSWDQDVRRKDKARTMEYVHRHRVHHGRRHSHSESSKSHTRKESLGIREKAR